MDQRYDSTYVQLPESMELLGLHKHKWGMISEHGGLKSSYKTQSIMGNDSQKLHLCLAYRVFHINCTDSSTLLAAFHRLQIFKKKKKVL